MGNLTFLNAFFLADVVRMRENVDYWKRFLYLELIGEQNEFGRTILRALFRYVHCMVAIF